MNKRVDEIIASLNTISLQIVVPLRKKVINKTAFSELFELINELQKILQDEKFINRELVEILFHVYTQLDMQGNYVENEEIKKEFTAYLGKMRSKMRGVFGTKSQQNAGLEEISVKDVMESTGKNLQEIMDEFKKLYE